MQEVRDPVGQRQDGRQPLVHLRDRLRFPLLRLGSRGPAVFGLQQALLVAGFDPGPVDGIYGLLTEAAVRELQEEAGLRPDGRAGPQVRAVLDDPYWARTRAQPDFATVSGLSPAAPAATTISAATATAAAPIPPESGTAQRRTYRLGLPLLAGVRAAPVAVAGQIPPGAVPHLTGVVCRVLDDSGWDEPTGTSRERDSWLPALRAAGLEGWSLIQLRPPAENEATTAARREGVAEKVRRAAQTQAALGAGGVLWDLRPWRLPDRWPQLSPLLQATRQGLTLGLPFTLAAWLPLPVRPSRSFTEAWERVLRSLRVAGVEFLWLSAWRRPEDWPYASLPLQLPELEHWVQRSLTVWPPWRVGLVLPTGGWRRRDLSHEPPDQLAVQAVVSLTRRECLRLGPRPGRYRRSGSTTPDWERDVGSGLLVRSDQQVYLVDAESWRAWLQPVARYRLGGVAIYGLGQEPLRGWSLLAQHSGRIIPAI